MIINYKKNNVTLCVNILKCSTTSKTNLIHILYVARLLCCNIKTSVELTLGAKFYFKPRLILKTNFLKQLNFKNRKIINYTLIVLIITLQIIGLLVWYNETSNESKLLKRLEDNNLANQIGNQTSSLNSSILKSQNFFTTYLHSKKEEDLKNYFKAIVDIKSDLESLELNIDKNINFNNLIQNKKNTEKNSIKLRHTIDSIISNNSLSKNNELKTPYLFNPFLYNNILDSVKTKTFISVDSVAKKGLLGRLIGAISGKIEVQKEHSNTVITMKYKDKVKTGTIEEQLKRLFQTTNYYYQKEFEKLKTTFASLRESDIQLMQLNNELLALSQNLIPEYNLTANKLKAQSHDELKQQFNTNKAIRSYSIAAIIILMFIISILLFGLSRLSFAYEKRLALAQEKISKSLEFKSKIMGMISHEIRSPLNIISLFSKKIGQSIKDDNLKDNFKSIEFTTNSLLLLSNQILEYSKNEGQKLTLQNKKFNLEEEVKNILSTISSFVESKKNTLNIKIDLNSNEEVYGDVTKIHQLFYNIIGNANKFTENGIIEVLVTQKIISDFELECNVTIQDNGIGISRDELANVFNSFYQANNQNTRELGIGLGLNLCKEIVELFDGTIAIESQENEGTKVSFNIILTRN